MCVCVVNSITRVSFWDDSFATSVYCLWFYVTNFHTETSQSFRSVAVCTFMVKLSSTIHIVYL